MNVTKIIKELISTGTKHRPLLILLSMITYAATPLIPSVGFRVGVATILATLSLLLLFDIYKELNEHFKKVEDLLANPKPPTFNDYTIALSEIHTAIEERLLANNTVKIRIMGVSAKSCFPNLIRGFVEKFLQAKTGTGLIDVEMAIVRSDVLESWKQDIEKTAAEHTIHGVDAFREKWSKLLPKSRLRIRLYLYDNLPQSHGVLIDNNVLFVGEALWESIADQPEIKLGSNPYRRFEANDRFGGYAQIGKFNNWYDAYIERHKKHTNEQGDEPNLTPYELES